MKLRYRYRSDSNKNEIIVEKANSVTENYTMIRQHLELGTCDKFQECDGWTKILGFIVMVRCMNEKNMPAKDPMNTLRAWGIKLYKKSPLRSDI